MKKEKKSEILPSATMRSELEMEQKTMRQAHSVQWVNGYDHYKGRIREQGEIEDGYQLLFASWDQGKFLEGEGVITWNNLKSKVMQVYFQFWGMSQVREFWQGKF